MVSIFLMMCQGEESEEEEGDKVAMEEVIKNKAEEMFINLDMDGDGELTEANINNDIIFLTKCFNHHQEEFMTGCLSDEDLMRQLAIG